MEKQEYDEKLALVKKGSVVEVGGRTAHTEEQFAFAVKAAGGVDAAEVTRGGVEQTTQPLTASEQSDLAAGKSGDTTARVQAVDRNATPAGNVAPVAAADKAAADKAAADKAADLGMNRDG